MSYPAKFSSCIPDSFWVVIRDVLKNLGTGSSTLFCGVWQFCLSKQLNVSSVTALLSYSSFLKTKHCYNMPQGSHYWWPYTQVGYRTLTILLLFCQAGLTASSWSNLFISGHTWLRRSQRTVGRLSSITQLTDFIYVMWCLKLAEPVNVWSIFSG